MPVGRADGGCGGGVAGDLQRRGWNAAEVFRRGGGVAAWRWERAPRTREMEPGCGGICRVRLRDWNGRWRAMESVGAEAGRMAALRFCV